MSTAKKRHTPEFPDSPKRIFVTVQGGVADVDSDTVPEGIEVEIIDIDDLRSDARYVTYLSAEAKAYGRKNGFL